VTATAVHTKKPETLSSARRRWLPRPETLAVVAGLALVAALFLNVSPRNPPAFNRDEASNAYNAYTLETTGKDEYGARFPLFIRAFGDWRSPLYIYLLAGVFRVTGPSVEAARTLSAVIGLGAVLLLYLLALAISGRRWLALIVALLAGLSPWLFELSRLAFEVALLPLVLALLFFTVHRASTREWRLGHSVAIGLLLTAIPLTYTAGRLLGPLLGLALVVCWFRKWRQLAVVWAVFLVTAAVPIGIWSLSHPKALQARYNATTWIVHGMSTSTIVTQYVRHYFFDNLNLWGWVTQGDPDIVDHVTGAGSIFYVELLLALAGIVVILLRRRSDPWWRFVLCAFLISGAAGATMAARIDARPDVILALVLPLLAIPALETIASLPAVQARTAVAVLLVALAVETVHWQAVYWHNGPKRQDGLAFDAWSAPLIKTAIRQNSRLYAFREDHWAYVQMLFDAAVMGRSPSSTVILDWGERPPPGSHVLLSLVACPQCTPVLERPRSATEEYIYKPARPGVVTTSFELSSPLRPFGQPNDFTVWLENHGATVADHVMLEIKLPPSMRLTGPPYSDLGQRCTEASTIVCNVGWLPGHAVTVVRYEVVVNEGGPQKMTAEIDTDELDVNTGLKSSSAYTLDVTPPESGHASAP
jgi:4-amino-4-deoxy-L-arabinose transferase-like glycosyltransferase